MLKCDAKILEEELFASRFRADFKTGKTAHTGVLVAPRPAVGVCTIQNVGRGATNAPRGRSAVAPY